MPKNFSREPKNLTKAVKTQGIDLRVSYKNTYETARALRGMNLKKAREYLNAVLEHKRCIPFRRYKLTGRTAQAKEFNTDHGRWPEKSIKVVLGLLKNMEANANVKQLNIEDLVISHVQVNRAQKGRRRTFRAHGRITPFLSHPCHVEIFAEEKEKNVKRETESKVCLLYTSPSPRD